MKLVFWSDYACPYCYIGEARLHKAIRELGLENDIELEPRAFELDPGASESVVSDTASRFASKYRLSVPQAMAQIEHISSLGQAEGLDFRYATTRYTNTFDAHRLMKLALSTGDKAIAAKTNELLFEAYFSKNLELADPTVLIAVGMQAGLEEAKIKAMLDSDEFSREVRADEEAASRRGVHGVPYFVFPDGATVPGAVSTADFRQLLQLNSQLVSPDIAHCGPDGCAVNFGKPE